MTSYIALRRRWWQKQTALDKDIMVSDRVLAGYLLQCATLSDEQQLLIKANLQGKLAFEGVTSMLRKNFSRIRQKETRRRPDRQDPQGQIQTTNDEEIQSEPEAVQTSAIRLCSGWRNRR